MSAQGDTTASRAGWVGFLSDYGWSDCFVGVCHGVIAQIAPTVRVIDICHEVPPGDLRLGAALLAQSAPYMPKGVLLAIVDPGVGTKRRALAVRTVNGSCLVGPDNGLLLPAARVLGGIESVYEITKSDLMRRPVSATFHGRDVFAPVAARVAAGMDPARVGARLAVDDLVHAAEPVARLTAHRLEGEVLTVDRYGNVQTSLGVRLLADGGLSEGATLRLNCRTGEVQVPFKYTFADVADGMVVGYIDSAGMFAVALNGRSASLEYDLRPGDPVALRVGV